MHRGPQALSKEDEEEDGEVEDEDQNDESMASIQKYSIAILKNIE